MIFAEILYFVSAFFLAIYGFHCLLMTGLFIRYRQKDEDPRPGRPSPFANEDNLPQVTVQLPIYNERHVVGRLLEAIINLDWPNNRLQVQVLDDSTDDTTQLVAGQLYRFREQGISIEHIHRSNRQAFKAGALQNGLATATGEFIAIFDADFVPSPDFLRRTMPHFGDGRSRIGCVQTRWGHVNPEHSWLTRAQAAGIDGHFIVEQTVRNDLGAYLNFNGTGGIWQRSCIDEAGGWQDDTLTEDLDLSYRAQLAGWSILYRPDILVPAELPVQLDAFKAQQFRWAKGSIQTSKKLLGQVWRSPRPWWHKLLATVHMTNYVVHPFLLINLMLILPLLSSASPLLRLTPILVISAIGPTLMYLTALRWEYGKIDRPLKKLVVLLAVGIGLSVSNSRAVLEALVGIQSGFKRTPKFAVTNQFSPWQASRYTVPLDPVSWIELLLAVYGVALLGIMIEQGAWWLIPWLLLYVGGYGYVVGLSFVQAWQARTVSPLGPLEVEPQ